MLDTIVMLNAIPKRFRKIDNKYEQYFGMARGYKESPAMEMTKWFNTNYHYIVPELSKDMDFKLDSSKIMSEYNEATVLEIYPKINIIEPITFLGLSKTHNGESSFEYFDRIMPIYENLVRKLSELDKEVHLQIEESIFVKNPDDQKLELLRIAYNKLASVSDNVKIIVTTYFEHSVEATSILADLPIWGIGLDFVYGNKNIEVLELLKDKNIKLIAGLIDGRNIWINDFRKTLSTLNKINKQIEKDRIIISSSCSLLHLPYSIENEPYSKIKKWLSFSCEKVKEIYLISQIFHSDKLSENDIILKNEKLIKEKGISTILKNEKVIEKIKNITNIKREGNYLERLSIQENILDLPGIPTTTIGSFPQTKELRNLRKDYKKSIISKEEYEDSIKKYIDYCIKFQEEVNVNVLVHGEPERNDMVEYFGEMLEGFHFTKRAWVQSYVSRCVKPPIIFGDVDRLKPMTVKWIKYAQSKTNKIVKGMLTGPVTILNWSFVRNDKPRHDVAKQIAVALSDEINDLQLAGTKIIQVDEAAFKEGYPLRKENITDYEKWAVENFKLAVSTAKKGTQIRTHMCYSDFNDIIKTIEKMDADVITIENARSGNEILKIFKEVGYKNKIGPGVYDIHSPRIPSIEEIEEQIRLYLEIFPKKQIWINPNCGLKTRKWHEVQKALNNMVKAVEKIKKNR